MCQTRVYEKIRFPRVRRAQTNGEDVRDRWHSALDKVADGEEIDPKTIFIRVSYILSRGNEFRNGLTRSQNRILYDYDAEAETRKQWPQLSLLVMEELRSGNITPLC